MLRRAMDWIVADWALKLTALALAFLLWTTVQADAPGEWAAGNIPVRVVNNDPDWVVVDAPVPNEVRVTFSGPYRELLRAASERPDIIVPVDRVSDSTGLYPLSPGRVRMPPGTPNVVVTNVQPENVRLSFDRVLTRLIPLAVQLQGSLGAGYEMAGPVVVDPSVVRASGAGRDLARIDTLRLPAIDLRDRHGTDTLELTIDTTGTGLILSPRTVRVIVPVRPLLGDQGRGPDASAPTALPPRMPAQRPLRPQDGARAPHD
jgi:YbbR domain-containing protein